MSTDPPTSKPPVKSSDWSLLVFLGIIVLAAGALFLSSIFRSSRSFGASLVATPRPRTQFTERIVSGSGRGDTVSEEFDVPWGCSKAILTYSGQQIDRDIDVAWVSFRVYDRQIADYSIDSSGPHDLIDSDSGSSRLTLPAGNTYYVETTAFNASWRFHIDCD